ncbi:hypothetical protein [Butyrivibrio sp. AE3004]|uniref:hypothetical protein n=1 Tax=Butyrivibrio sp. AE3004 TaxID=1506994 RepID=UPI00049494FC|nr:hypothetical protein [Butyrivibrio sp. AE3004]
MPSIQAKMISSLFSLVGVNKMLDKQGEDFQKLLNKYVEKQKIPLKVMLLDEPTSNLDSLNEAVILKSLKEEAKEKTVVLVSHRESTMRIADEILKYCFTIII